jgi:hypothetical protein
MGDFNPASWFRELFGIAKDITEYEKTKMSLGILSLVADSTTLCTRPAAGSVRLIPYWEGGGGR